MENPADLENEGEVRWEEVGEALGGHGRGRAPEGGAGGAVPGEGGRGRARAGAGGRARAGAGGRTRAGDRGRAPEGGLWCTARRGRAPAGAGGAVPAGGRGWPRENLAPPLLHPVWLCAAGKKWLRKKTEWGICTFIWEGHF